MGSDRFPDSQYDDSMEASPLLRIGGHQRAISIKYHHGEEKLKEVTITRVESASREFVTMSKHHCPSCGYQLREFEAIKYGNVQIDPPGRITFSSYDIELAPTQFIVADALIRARGRGIYRSTLANLIGPDLSEQAITVYIRRLRDAFRKLDPSFNQIECLRGFGAYRWVEVAVN